MKVIVPLGGKGSRLYPATKSVSKEFLALVDRPIIDYAINEILNSGFDFKDIIFVASQNKKFIQNYFEPHKAIIVNQPKPIGNGDALAKTSRLIGENPAAVVFSDEVLINELPILAVLKQWFEKLEAPIIALNRIPKQKVGNYGVVEWQKVSFHPKLCQIKNIIEKPKPEKAPSNLTALGRYIITPPIFAELKKLKPRPNKEMTLTEAFLAYLKKGGRIYGYEYEGERYDCGSKIGLLKAQVGF
ncbi:MAG: sugar phosphate nucleotidyltransferase [Patescibacteria group bacterium]